MIMISGVWNTTQSERHARQVSKTKNDMKIKNAYMVDSHHNTMSKKIIQIIILPKLGLWHQVRGQPTSSFLIYLISHFI
jgi:hypothetical protein